MNDIVVLCPTRGRPEAAAEMVTSLRETAHLLATEVILVVDDDDPCLKEYLLLPDKFNGSSSGPLKPPNPLRVMVLSSGETGNLTAATNTSAARVWDEDCIIGHVGDDHRFRTPGWDKIIVETLAEPGVAAPDDGFYGGQVPTAVFISSVIPRKLGWYALPTTYHLFIDNAWRSIGDGIGSYHMLPDVLVEHMHPDWGKGVNDWGYEHAKAGWSHDQSSYEAWVAGQREADIARIL